MESMSVQPEDLIKTNRKPTKWTNQKTISIFTCFVSFVSDLYLALVLFFLVIFYFCFLFCFFGSRIKCLLPLIMWLLHFLVVCWCWCWTHATSSCLADCCTHVFCCSWGISQLPLVRFSCDCPVRGQRSRFVLRGQHFLSWRFWQWIGAMVWVFFR